MNEKPTKEPWRDSPTAWFATLDRARNTGDAELAAKAKSELKRLGVRVDFAATPRKAVRNGK